jgi:enoyl-CoA hydratase
MIDQENYTGLEFSWPAPRVLQVTIATPGRLNSLDVERHGELARVWRDVDADQRISAVLLTGSGGVFSAGGDLSLLEAYSSDWDALVNGWKEARDLVQNMIACAKPIVAALEGPAVGAGLAAALLSDVVVAGRTARIIDGHTKIGVAAGDHAAILWPLLCGMAKAKYYLLLSETLTGEEAERIGLVSLCVDDDVVRERALAVCERLAAMPPSAVRWTKYALNNWLRLAGPTFDTSLALEMLGFRGPEVREGLSALREKRPPAFDPDSPL